MLLYKRTVPVPGFVMTVLIYMYGQVKERSNLPRFPTCHDRHSTVVLNAVPSSRCRSARLAASLARCRECGARPARCQAGATRLAARHARDRDVLAGRRSRASLTQPAGMIAWRPPGWPPGSHAADSQRLSHLGHAAEHQTAGVASG